MRRLVNSALCSLKPLANIMVCMMLIIVVYGCVGMQLWGAHMDHLEVRVRVRVRVRIRVRVRSPHRPWCP